MLISWKRVEFKAWDKSCRDCAIKRGWVKEIQSMPYPFNCVHRVDNSGRQLVCAGDKKKLEEFKK